MNARELIEAYVTDVAVRLPRKQRNDVAFELRELLLEALQDKADAAGCEPDAAMATALLHAFGHPADVAARYRPALTIIDPADGYTFLRAVVVGLAIIWGAGLLMSLQQPIDSGGDLLRVLGQWWGSSVLSSLWWPGLLVVNFGLASWVRRRWPGTAQWKPRADDHIGGGRAAMVLGLVAILCGVFVLLDPRWVLDFFWAGKAAPAAYEALTYTAAFRERQGPILLVLILSNIPIMMTAIVLGRWPAIALRIEVELALVECAVMAWAVLDGPILMTPSGDKTAKFFMVLIVACTLVIYAIKLHRSVRPTPNRQNAA